MKEKGADYWKEKLELSQHPEGGWFREIYRAGEEIIHSSLPSRFTGNRSFSTSIYYLLEKGQFSAFHRIKSDELWHFYAGFPLNIHVIHTDGKHEIINIGNNPDANEQLQAVIPAGCWFGSIAENPYTLAGCTVSPGFNFADFEMAERNALIEEFPHLKEIIHTLTKPS